MLCSFNFYSMVSKRKLISAGLEPYADMRENEWADFQKVIIKFQSLILWMLTVKLIYC